MPFAAYAGLVLLLLTGLCAGEETAAPDADVPRVTRLRPQADPPPQFSRDQTVPLFPDVMQVELQPDKEKKDQPRADKLQPRSRLELYRFVSGEFARAVKPIPGGKDGYHYKAGQPLDEQTLQKALTKGGAVASPGDSVQITRLEFKDKEIVVEINGGAKKKTKWRDRIQIGMGGSGGMATTGGQGGPQGFQPPGATLVLDYGRPLPDLTPDELKKHLGTFLDFSKQRSAAVQWVETLPPEVQLAIKDKRAIVGMDREMVVAAIGKPERKVRERDPDGLETEDWIYGHPPAKTVFVKFAGDKVISVKQFPN